jgi:hypothetical protein
MSERAAERIGSGTLGDEEGRDRSRGTGAFARRDGMLVDKGGMLAERGGRLAGRGGRGPKPVVFLAVFAFLEYRAVRASHIGSGRGASSDEMVSKSSSLSSSLMIRGRFREWFPWSPSLSSLPVRSMISGTACGIEDVNL